MKMKKRGMGPTEIQEGGGGGMGKLSVYLVWKYFIMETFESFLFSNIDKFSDSEN